MTKSDEGILHEFTEWCDENIKPLEHKRIGIKEWNDLMNSGGEELKRITENESHYMSFACGVAFCIRSMTVKTEE